MAASSEIRYKISGDTSALSRAFVAAESVAASAGKQLRKKLGMEDTFKSAILTLGVSIEKIVEQLAEMATGGPQEVWKEALTSANESARIIEESTRRRMSNLRQIADIEKQIARRAGDEDPTPRPRSNSLLDYGAKFFDAIGAKNAASSFRRANVELPAVAAARAAAANRDRLADEAKLAELKEREAANQERIAEARRSLERIGIGGEQKIAAAHEDAVRAEEALEEARRKGADTTEKELTYLARVKTYREAILDTAKATAEAQRKEAEQAREDEAAELQAQEKLAEARGRVSVAANQADQANQLARRDALAFTIDDAASGKRGTASDRAKAKAIQRDEATARRLADSGLAVTQYDSTIGKNVDVRAAFFQDRAQQMREGMSGAKSAEKNQFAVTEERLEEAVAELRDISESLKSTKVSGR
jgi:hypothetical protein